MSLPESPRHRDPSHLDYQDAVSPGLTKVLAGAFVSAPGWICIGVLLGWLIWA